MDAHGSGVLLMIRVRFFCHRATRVKKPAQDKVTAPTATAPSVPLVDQHERPLIINFSGTK